MNDYDKGRIDAIDSIGRELREMYDELESKIKESNSFMLIADTRSKASLLHDIIIKLQHSIEQIEKESESVE